MRKTVEFVSERIASTAVKHICHNLVPKAKEAALSDLKSLLKSDNIDQYIDDNHRKVMFVWQNSMIATVIVL